MSADQDIDDTGAATIGSVPQLPTVSSHASIPAVHSYQIKPHLRDKFKAEPILEIVRNALAEKLTGKGYDSEKIKKWTVELSNEISEKIVDLKMNRYKHIVQITIGEQKGAGVRSGMRCLWDAETDGYACEIYNTDALWCQVLVFGVYLY